jgi:hypothetical protein
MTSSSNPGAGITFLPLLILIVIIVVFVKYSKAFKKTGQKGAWKYILGSIGVFYGCLIPGSIVVGIIRGGNTEPSVAVVAIITVIFGLLGVAAGVLICRKGLIKAKIKAGETAARISSFAHLAENSTEDITDPDKINDRPGIILSIRENRFIGRAALNTVLLNGVEIGKMDNGAYLSVKTEKALNIITLKEVNQSLNVTMGNGECAIVRWYYEGLNGPHIEVKQTATIEELLTIEAAAADKYKRAGMGSLVIGLLVSIALIIGGLSGEFVLRGTNSSGALIAAGFAFLAFDIFKIIKHSQKGNNSANSLDKLLAELIKE